MKLLVLYLYIALGLASLTPAASKVRPIGAVYAQSNDLRKNTIVAYARMSDDTFKLIGTFPTGGKGANLNNNSVSDPLISQNSVVVTPNRRYLLAVNAGSNSVSLFKVLPDFSLKLRSVRRVAGVGPVAIAVNSRGLVYVASADADGKFTNTMDSAGALTALLIRRGKLFYIRRSIRKLSGRPADVNFSPDGRSLVVSILNPFAFQMKWKNKRRYTKHYYPRYHRSGEVLVFKLFRNGRLSKRPVDAASSTMPGDASGRAPPVGFGFRIVKVRGVQYVVVTEVRGPKQTGSISTWKLTFHGKLIPVQLDLPIGRSITKGQRATCWIVFNSTKTMFYVTNTGSGSVSSLSFRNGISKLVLEVAASGETSTEGVIDIGITPDDKFLLVHGGQLGDIGAFKIRGRGRKLKLVKTLGALPDGGTQGVAVL